MPEVPNAYRCDYCHVLMEPVEQNDGRWHTKWCSACGAKIWDTFIGGEYRDPDPTKIMGYFPQNYDPTRIFG